MAIRRPDTLPSSRRIVVTLMQGRNGSTLSVVFVPTRGRFDIEAAASILGFQVVEADEVIATGIDIRNELLQPLLDATPAEQAEIFIRPGIYSERLAKLMSACGLVGSCDDAAVVRSRPADGLLSPAGADAPGLAVLAVDARGVYLLCGRNVAASVAQEFARSAWADRLQRHH